MEQFIKIWSSYGTCFGRYLKNIPPPNMEKMKAGMLDGLKYRETHERFSITIFIAENYGTNYNYFFHHDCEEFLSMEGRMLEFYI